MSERQAPPRCIDSPDPTLADRFEAWWQTSPRRNQNMIGHSDKRALAVDAFEAGASTSSGDAVREALTQAEADFEEHASFAQSELEAGDEEGSTVWRNALATIKAEASANAQRVRATLAKHGGGQ